MKEVVELARTHTTFAIEQLVEIAGDKRAAAMARVQAAKALLDRGWGQPAVETDLDGVLGNQGPIVFVFNPEGARGSIQAAEFVGEAEIVVDDADLDDAG